MRRPLCLLAMLSLTLACSDPGVQSTGDSAGGSMDPESSGGPSDTGSSGSLPVAVPDGCLISPKTRVDVHGVVQKGPFTGPAMVSLVAVDPRGELTGERFEQMAVVERGAYTIEAVPAGPVSVTIEGNFHDELDDVIAAGPITLRALGRAARDVPLNVNVLTHIAEARARALFGAGMCLEEAIAQAEQEARYALRIGSLGFMVTGPATQADLVGADTNDNAYLLALSVVLLQDQKLNPGDLQQRLDQLAADLADDGEFPCPFKAAESAVPVDLVHEHLAKYLASVGAAPEHPDLYRILDQDHDGWPNNMDNCPFVSNYSQSQVCCEDDSCECGFQAPDGDGDGYPDDCDNCPLIHNDLPGQDPGGLPTSDRDGDGIGNVCDACAFTPEKGAVPGEHCCDPRFGTCLTQTEGGNLWTFCRPRNGSLNFHCQLEEPCGHLEGLCNGPMAPPGALACNPDLRECYCDAHSCSTWWCTVGDDAACKHNNVCLAWYKPGEAPAGSETLGVCARIDQGPCVGTVGRGCISG